MASDTDPFAEAGCICAKVLDSFLGLRFLGFGVSKQLSWADGKSAQKTSLNPRIPKPLTPEVFGGTSQLPDADCAGPSPSHRLDDFSPGAQDVPFLLFLQTADG